MCGSQGTRTRVKNSTHMIAALAFLTFVACDPNNHSIRILTLPDSVTSILWDTLHWMTMPELYNKDATSKLKTIKTEYTNVYATYILFNGYNNLLCYDCRIQGCAMQIEFSFYFIFIIMNGTSADTKFIQRYFITLCLTRCSRLWTTLHTQREFLFVFIQTVDKSCVKYMRNMFIMNENNGLCQIFLSPDQFTLKLWLVFGRPQF